MNLHDIHFVGCEVDEKCVKKGFPSLVLFFARHSVNPGSGMVDSDAVERA